MYEVVELDYLPHTLAYLHFGREFNQSINALGELELESLIFGTMSHFNHPINVLSKLNHLRNLCFCGYFDQDITPLANMQSLRELKFGICFNQSIDSLGSLINLEKLVFVGNFNQNIDSLATLINLKYIRFGTNFNQPVDALAHMENLEEIVVNNSRFKYGKRVIKITKVLPLLEYVTVPMHIFGKKFMHRIKINN